ncbi:hypothetical protein [Streptomyces sp. NPDC127066]|uniref:hypothetical protein n=1 Tax=Streptomyces sp. NPDC127066 TaxID=3347125 RepID=UPI0036616C41
MPGLKGTAFASGIDAACGVPDSGTDLYLFRGEQHLRYRGTDEKVVSDPKTPTEHLIHAGYALGSDDGCITDARRHALDFLDFLDQTEAAPLSVPARTRDPTQ